MEPLLVDYVIKVLRDSQMIKEWEEENIPDLAEKILEAIDAVSD